MRFKPHLRLSDQISALTLLCALITSPAALAGSVSSGDILTFEKTLETQLKTAVEEVTAQFDTNPKLKLISKTFIEPPAKRATGTWFSKPVCEQGPRDLHRNVFTAKFQCNSDCAILSTGRGKVLYVGWYGGYGRVAIIKYAHDYFVLYAHLRAVSVAKNQYIHAGQEIGRIGSTVFTTGRTLRIVVSVNSEIWEN